MSRSCLLPVTEDSPVWDPRSKSQHLKENLGGSICTWDIWRGKAESTGTPQSFCDSWYYALPGMPRLNEVRHL